MEKARQVLDKTDIALLVIDAAEGMHPEDEALLQLLREKKLPPPYRHESVRSSGKRCAPCGSPRGNCPLGQRCHRRKYPELKEAIAALRPSGPERRIVADLLSPGDLVVLVTPIDEAAPKGRLILPQQQTIRDILDAGAMAVVTKETELPQGLAALKEPPRMVITDSQAFKKVSADVPTSIPLTSFSILFARYKGNLPGAIRGVKALESWKTGTRC